MNNEILSKSNPRVKFIKRLLTSSKQRQESGLFAVEGVRLCYDIVRSGIKARELYYTDSAYKKSSVLVDELKSSADESFVVGDEAFCKMTDTVTPQGVLCVLDMPKTKLKIEEGGKYIVLCDVQDPSNLGAVARTAEAFAVSGIIVCGGCDIYNSKALRASMGAFFRIPTAVMNVDDMLNAFKDKYITTYASTPDSNAVSIAECDFSSGCAMLVGNEANGLKKEIISACDKAVTIPMSGRAESLNASVAASILMYEMVKQR
ncbi:MAG: RNA methyltransferase [Clostridia bacterium]|nr:RNA methyltransferase [Clostridia bacterium]MEE1024214.1 RNA methyltransferase [Acutalibacteraceae bacterium]